MGTVGCCDGKQYSDVPVSTLLTYENLKYNFKFEYPEYFGIFEDVSNNTDKINCNLGSYDTAIIASARNLSVIISCPSATGNSLYKENSRQNISINGKDGYIFNYTSATGYSNTEIYIPTWDGMYIGILYFYKAGQPNSYKELSQIDLEKIISSFRFIPGV